MAIGKSYVGTKNFKIRPNSFYVEKQVDVGVALSSEHRDFAQSIDEGYKLVSGIKVPAVVLSGNVNTKESVKEGDYALMGGFLRTFVSGVTINNARGKPPVLEAYTTNSPYPITEGGMTFAKNRLDGTIVADGTVAVVGTNTDFESTSNGNRPLLATGSKVYINDIKYEVATITDDTNLTLTTIVPAGTYEVEMDSFIGDKEYVSCMAYNNGGNVNVTPIATNNAGNGGAHNHSHNLSGSISGAPGTSGNVTAGNLAVGASTAAINVQYVDFIIANKD